jgi:hypothetical protein
MPAYLRATTELSSLVASSTIRRLGAFLRSRMAVETSFFSSLTTGLRERGVEAEEGG